MLADEIRRFVFREYIEPARLRGEHEVTIRAGDVHDRMGLVSRMPAVCGAIGADKFQDEYRVRLINRKGPNNGANARRPHLTLEFCAAVRRGIARGRCCSRRL